MNGVPEVPAATERVYTPVFNLLKRRGPLSESQIAVELCYASRAEVHPLCLMLAETNIIVRRPDCHPNDDDDPVWGIDTRFWRMSSRNASSGEA